MDNFQKLINDLEKEFLYIVIRELRAGNLKLVAAKSKTREFLGLLPFSDEKDLNQKIKEFCQKNPEFIGLELFLRKKEEEEKTKEVLKKMELLLKLGKIDEALTVAKEKNVR